jgi:protein-tyrosine phosphatase
MNLLFICSRNQWRSPTAEKIFQSQNYSTKSAGTEESARIRVNEKLIHWADIIFVMEKKHKQKLQLKFRNMLDDKSIVVLDIPDEYNYMDEELISMLQLSVSSYLSQSNN